MAEDISKIDKKLSEAFKAIKEDMGSIRDEISSLKNKKPEKQEKQDNSEIKRLSKNIIDLTEYFSDLKSEIKEIKNTKPEKQETSEVSNLIEFSEVKSELADLKELIENIEIPEQKDYSKELKTLAERIDNFEELIEDTKKSIKSIKIPIQKDYSEDINELAKEIGEIKGSLVSRKYLNKETEKISESLSEKIQELQEKQGILSQELEDKARSPIVFSLRQEIKQLKAQIEDEQEKSQEVLAEIKSENKKLKSNLEEQNSELKLEIASLKGRITRLVSKKEVVEEVEPSEPFKWPKINQKAITIIVSIILVLLIIGAIIIFVDPSVKAKYEPVDVVISNSSSLPMNLYLHQAKLNFMLYGWEGKLTYDGKEDRIAGNNMTGWFFNSTINISENKVSNNKYVSAELIPSNNSITDMLYNYTLFKNKPYFKVQFSAITSNNSKLGLSAYGINAKGYDIYLQNGSILNNDNNVTTVNDTPIRTGSTYNLNDSDYEIFFNSNTTNVVIAYSPSTVQFRNSFYWNVYWVYVNGVDGKYTPLYFIVLENANLTFSQGKWQVTSKYYSGDLEQYINKSVSAMS